MVFITYWDDLQHVLQQSIILRKNADDLYNLLKFVLWLTTKMYGLYNLLRWNKYETVGTDLLV